MVAHPLPMSGLPERRRPSILQILGQLVALRVGFPSPLCGITGQNRWKCIEQTRSVSCETGGGDENAALADDDSLAFGFEVPEIGQSQRHKRSRRHAWVGALRLSADAVEASIDHDPVQTRIGASSDGCMAERSNCRQEVHSGVTKPGSFSAQAGQSRQNFPLPLEIVLPHTVQHYHQYGARTTSR